MANLCRAISDNGAVVVSCINSTNIINSIKKIFNCNNSVIATLGRLSTATLLMSSMLKHEKETITVQFNGGGPIGTILAVGNSKGKVKCHASNMDFDEIYGKDKQPDISSIVGNKGMLTVIKDMGLKSPYVGQIPIYSGSIASDITAYYAHSEQIPNVCGLGVMLNGKEIEIGGGYLVQILPSARETDISIMESNINKIKSVCDLFLQGNRMEEIALKILEGFKPHILDISDCSYECECSSERVYNVIKSIEKIELDKMLEEDGKIEINCNFCNKKYVFKKEDIKI